jgi:hypothetical protein
MKTLNLASTVGKGSIKYLHKKTNIANFSICLLSPVNGCFTTHRPFTRLFSHILAVEL